MTGVVDMPARDVRPGMVLVTYLAEGTFLTPVTSAKLLPAGGSCDNLGFGWEGRCLVCGAPRPRLNLTHAAAERVAYQVSFEDSGWDQAEAGREWVVPAGEILCVEAASVSGAGQ